MNLNFDLSLRAPLMTKIYNINNVPADYCDDPQFISNLQTSFLGALGGSEKIYVNVDRVKPGGQSTKYHAHSLQEEFFLILKGSGVLRLNDQTFDVKEGDFFSKPAGKNIAHQFINNSDSMLEILDCGTGDENDVVFYPDESIVRHKKTGVAYRGDDVVADWSSDPNE